LRSEVKFVADNFEKFSKVIPREPLKSFEYWECLLVSQGTFEEL